MGRTWRLSAASFASALLLAPAAHAQTRVPNDPLFPQQWFYAQPNGADIEGPQAWATRTSCGTVAIVDTGADLNHPDLQTNLWQNPGEIPANGIDDDKNGYVDDVNGVDIRNGGAPVDTNGHGTHVAGLVGAKGNNGLGVTGVCWRAKLMVVKFMSVFGRGKPADAANGIRYAVKEGARIINCSFGTSSQNEQLHDAIQYARSKGALVVVAAATTGRTSTPPRPIRPRGPTRTSSSSRQRRPAADSRRSPTTARRPSTSPRPATTSSRRTSATATSSSTGPRWPRRSWRGSPRWSVSRTPS